MAEVEKSRGLKFAEQQLLRHGWEHGKGLGREENGISEAIKVKVKCDKGGVGHKEGDQFTFHWWDHVFNKASSSLQVESDPNGIKLKKTVEEDEDDGIISNKKPRKAALAKAKLYGCFVKSATLLSGQEQPEKKASDSDDDSSSSDEDDDRRLDLSTTTQLTDADLMKACGGRTAHKGARHGLTMSAKLARLEQQEAEFMAKYGKKSQSASVSPDCVAATPPITDQRAESQEETAEESESKQKKKKKKSVESFNGINSDDGAACEKVKPKKKKKKSKDSEEITAVVSSTVMCVENGEAETKRKHKKKKNDTGEEKAAEIPEEAAEVSTEPHSKVKKKKKKKSSKHDSDPAARDAEEEAATVTEEAAVVSQKRKKDSMSLENATNEEALPPKKKKKKKSKD